MKLQKVSSRTRTVIKKMKVTRTKFNINGYEFTDTQFNPYPLLEALAECDYGFNYGLTSTNKYIEKFLMETGLGEKSSRGGWFPTELFYRNEKKIFQWIKESRGY